MHEAIKTITNTDAVQPIKKRQLGTMPDLVIYMSDDFDEPLDGFEEYTQ